MAGFTDHLFTINPKTGEIVGDDLFNTNADAIMIPVNCVGVMGKGLALQAKNKWPELDALYKYHLSEGLLKLGQVSFVNVTNHLTVVLIATKDHWRDPSQLNWIDAGLRNFIKQTHEETKYWGITSVAIPELGCGLGGLDWQLQVKPLIDDIMQVWDGHTHTYTYYDWDIPF